MKTLYALLLFINCTLSAIPFYIPANEVEALLADSPGKTVQELMLELVPVAKNYARPEISKYKVGVVGLGASGSLYLGVNLEFQDLPATIHGEQFMLINARNHGEEVIRAIAISAAPCGFCRQFINEIGDRAQDIVIYTPNNAPKMLSELLPSAFGPHDLALVGGMLSGVNLLLSDDPYERVKEAASASYAPYTNCQSGVTIVTKDGQHFSGSYIENAAYNPAVSPMVSALVSLVAANVSYSAIETVLLAEEPNCAVHQVIPTVNIMSAICPNAELVYIPL